MKKRNSIWITTLLIMILTCTSCSKDDEVVETEAQDVPIVSVSAATNIAGDIASAGGAILSDGNGVITKKGVCWSTSPNPDITDNSVDSGTGNNDFISQMSNLEFNTVYYLRAYAENSQGIAYSDEVTFTTNNICTLNIYDGEYFKLTNQSEVNALGAMNYCALTSELWIEEEDGTQDPIVDLSPLQNLRSVNHITISNTSSLETLEGLNNISIVEDFISIRNNDALLNIDALANITSEISLVDISINPLLTNIDGISGITKMVEPDYDNVTGIYIGVNPQLQNINGLQNIYIEGDRGAISISGSDFITNLDPLSNIFGEIEVLQITNLPNLESTAGLAQITSITEQLFLTDITDLSTLDGLQNISSISGEMILSFNQGITNLDIFANTEISGTLGIYNNFNLTDYCALLDDFNAGTIVSFNTDDNGYNPTQADMINGDCAL